MLAINRCAEELGAQGKKSTTKWIYSDSQAALKALENSIINSNLVESIKAELAEFEKGSRLDAGWKRRKS